MAHQQELVEQLFDAALAIKLGDRHAFLEKSAAEISGSGVRSNPCSSKILALEVPPTIRPQVFSTRQP